MHGSDLIPADKGREAATVHVVREAAMSPVAMFNIQVTTRRI